MLLRCLQGNLGPRCMQSQPWNHHTRRSVRVGLTRYWNARHGGAQKGDVWHQNPQIRTVRYALSSYAQQTGASLTDPGASALGPDNESETFHFVMVSASADRVTSIVSAGPALRAIRADATWIRRQVGREDRERQNVVQEDLGTQTPREYCASHIRRVVRYLSNE